MTTRIDTRFAALKKEGRAALVTFYMGGDPDPETSLKVIKALPKAGADLIEIGMAFTDPMADGPTIQAAGLRALSKGITLEKTLHLVREFRKDDNETPIILMGYFNPIFIYGVEKFLIDAKSSGVDGLIVVDCPPEEDDELCKPALKAGLNFIRLATPTTDEKRLPKVLQNTSGFVYYVSIAGITGAARLIRKKWLPRSRASKRIHRFRSLWALVCALQRTLRKSQKQPTVLLSALPLSKPCGNRFMRMDAQPNSQWVRSHPSLKRSPKVFAR